MYKTITLQKMLNVNLKIHLSSIILIICHCSRVEFAAASNHELIGDYSKEHALPCKMSSIGNTSTACISSQTLAELINHKYDDMIGSYSIIDCRYPYEYEGGHIGGALNIPSQEQMSRVLEKRINRRSNASITPTTKRGDILIFHCEYSSKRGPQMLHFVRKKDRNRNLARYPKLDFPEMYLLEGGYRDFYQYYPHLCEPHGYTPME